MSAQFFKNTVLTLQLALLTNFTSHALSCTRLFSCEYACYLSSLVLDMLDISTYFYILNSCEDFPMHYIIFALCPDHFLEALGEGPNLMGPCLGQAIILSAN